MRPQTNFFLALLVAIIAITFQMQDIKPDYYLGDAFAYLEVAKDFLDKGVITDGGFGNWSVVRGANGEGMFFTPLYPLILAGAMALDPELYNTVACHIDLGKAKALQECTNYFGILTPLHGLMAVIGVWLVWVSAYVISKRYGVAWVAFGLALLAECYAYYTGQVMTENIIFPLFTLSCLFFVMAVQRVSIRYFILAGLAFGALTLGRAAFAYAFYALVPFALVLLFLNKLQTPRKKLLSLLVFIAGFAVIVAPWVVRNGITMGTWGISQGYGGYTLAQRISFNDMTDEEWKASFIYGLPDFGDSLATDMFPPESYERLDYGNEDGFYMVGNSKVLYDTLEAAGGKENHQSYLIKEKILGNLGQHIKVTFSLVWRSIWVSKYWGLVAIPVFAVVFIYALFHLNRPWWSGFVLFSLPAWFMVGLHAFASVGVVRYSLILVPCLALAVAFTLVALWDKIPRKRG